MYQWLRYLRSKTKELEYHKQIARYDYFKLKKYILNQIKHECNKQAFEINKLIGTHLEEVYEDIFYQTALQLEKYDLEIPSKKEIYKITHATWVGNKNFEQRTYWNLNQLYEKYLTILNDEKKDLDEKLADLEALKKNYWYRIHRLVRTETMHIINASTMRVYRACGIELVKWITCMDEKTCPICGARDEMIYPINMCPRYPDHPFCRCVLVAVIDKKNDSDRMKLNDSDIHAIKRYISSDSYKINEKLRNNIELDDNDKEFINALDKTLEKLPKYNGEVTRDMQFFNDDELEKFMKIHKIDEIVKYPAYTSTTKSLESYNPNAEVTLYINSKNGRNLCEFNPEEEEILYNRNSKFKVRDIYHIENTYHILLEEI